MNDAADGANPGCALAWDMDGLPPAELEAAYTRLAEFAQPSAGSASPSLPAGTGTARCCHGS